MLPAFACSVAAVVPVKIGTLRVSPVGIGTLNLPLDKTADPATAAALASAAEAGVTLVDTAEAYGFGSSERLTRWAMDQSGLRAGNGADGTLALATKFAPLPWRPDAEAVVSACRASAERLGVDQIPLYQIHWPDIIQPLKPFGIERRKDELIWGGLARCYEEGLAANVGVCNYGPETLSRAYEALEKRGVPLVSNQINLSLLYRKDAAATLRRCEELGVKVLAYFPLANGLLAGRYDADNLPSFPKSLSMRKYVVGDGKDYPPSGVTPLVDAMRQVGVAHGKTCAQVALAWCVSKGAVPIPGARDATMARENAGAMGWTLSDEEVSALEAASDAVGFEFSSGGFTLD